MSFIGDITGGLVGESSAEAAAGRATQASKKSTKKAMGYIDEAGNFIDASLSPYAAYGLPAMENIAGMESPDAPTLSQFSFGREDLTDDPSYQFRLSEQMKGIDRVSAKNRGLTSGGRLAGAIERSGDVASQEYANAWQRAFNTNQANNQTMSQQYGLDTNKYGLDLARNQYLGDVGFGATQRQGDYRYRTAVDKGNLQIGHAANSTAADMFQAQNKSQYLSDLMGIAGSWAGNRSTT